MEHDTPTETAVMFDFEKSLWDNVVLQSMNTYVKIEEAIAAANKVITARRQMFNDQGEV